MPPDRMFRFSIENLSTHEVACFIGQGADFVEALKDGVKNCNSALRPKNDGKQRDNMGMAVTLPDGRVVTKQVEQFIAAAPAPAPAAVEEY